jgi:hypothetical protein
MRDIRKLLDSSANDIDAKQVWSLKDTQGKPEVGPYAAKK